MIRLFKNLYKKFFGIKETGKIWKAREHTSWGDSIQVSDWSKRSIYGFTPILERAIHAGDRIVFDLKSGRSFAFIVAYCKYQSEPQDMFFATLTDDDVLEEKDGAYLPVTVTA